MTYINYQKARDAAWESLIKNNVTSLPVKISKICKNNGIILLPYSKADPIIRLGGMWGDRINNDGFSTILSSSGKNISCIFYDDLECSQQRQRFTIGHELGHFLCGHVRKGQATRRNKEPSVSDPPIETQANIIASRILAPACVLWALHVRDAETIAKLCDISLLAAQWRMKRLNHLYEREKVFLEKYGKTCFLQSPLERKVFEQFQPFIKGCL